MDWHECKSCTWLHTKIIVIVADNMTAAAEELVSVAENFHENQVKTVNKQKLVSIYTCSDIICIYM